MGDDEFDERLDALDRFERTLDVQLALLSDIDGKAANVFRYTSLLLGVVFAALSLLSRSEVVSLSAVNLLPKLSFFVGVVGLVGAICAAILTYLSSVREYGPEAVYGYTVADGDVESPDYERSLLAGYADAVKNNRVVIDVNALRFRWALVGLLVGIVYSALAGGLVALVAPPWFEVLVIATVTALVIPAVYGIYTEDFLVIERKLDTDE